MSNHNFTQTNSMYHQYISYKSVSSIDGETEMVAMHRFDAILFIITSFHLRT